MDEAQIKFSKRQQHFEQTDKFRVIDMSPSARRSFSLFLSLCVCVL